MVSQDGGRTWGEPFPLKGPEQGYTAAIRPWDVILHGVRDCIICSLAGLQAYGKFISGPTRKPFHSSCSGWFPATNEPAGIPDEPRRNSAQGLAALSGGFVEEVKWAVSQFAQEMVRKPWVE